MRKVVSQQLRRCALGGFALCLLVGGVVLSGQMNALASASGATNRDAVYPTASISGTITDGGGNPISTKDVCVDAWSADDGNAFAQTITDASGNYSLKYLAAGDYQVYAYDCSWSARNDVPAYYGMSS